MIVFCVMRRRMEKYSQEDFAPHLDHEAEVARGLYGEGYIRGLYARQDVPGTIMQMEVESMEELDRVLARLPLISKGMIEPMIIPVGPHRCFFPKN